MKQDMMQPSIGVRAARSRSAAAQAQAQKARGAALRRRLLAAAASRGHGACKHSGDRLPQVIPGSEARIYYAGALYTIPEAFEAMRQGNLEMTWMQMGKAAPVDPWMMAVVGPGILTTAGRGRQLREDQDLPDAGRPAAEEPGDQGVRRRRT